jgi:hypothetical protein
MAHEIKKQSIEVFLAESEILSSILFIFLHPRRSSDSELERPSTRLNREMQGAFNVSTNQRIERHSAGLA